MKYFDYTHSALSQPTDIIIIRDSNGNYTVIREDQIDTLYEAVVPFIEMGEVPISQGPWTVRGGPGKYIIHHSDWESGFDLVVPDIERLALDLLD